MYTTVPPGVVVPFGDGGPDHPLSVSHFAAVAAATGDAVLQWFYDQHASEARFPCWELLWLDPDVEPQAPDPEALPLGRAYAAHSNIISSRTSWDQRDAACVVTGKAGHGGINHTHPDAGQVSIRGYGKRLIRDLGKVHYPWESKVHFYHFNTQGHNVLTIDGRELLWDRHHRARIVEAAFDNILGGWWMLDTTELYEGARSVRRTVIHLLPGIVTVLDTAEFGSRGRIRIRWHTETAATPDARGAIRVVNNGITLTGGVVRTDGGQLGYTHGRHRYEPPYDRDRMGNLHPQRNEPYFDAEMDGNECSILSLFSVYGHGERPAEWTDDEDGWGIDTPTGIGRVALAGGVLSVGREDAQWEVHLDCQGGKSS